MSDRFCVALPASYNAYQARGTGGGCIPRHADSGHSCILVSQRYIHPIPEAMERAFERLQLSGDFAVIEPKRLPPATLSAPYAGRLP